ncbi:DUF3291 domain-containing protein [Lentisphaera profundi]|uniref:DUF3291 domain-containing protein n=1 Tax=Lentisphaera profundi TaxID=1658616 RepID=A0ABY7VP62_9BACT|nr:DUF3291 domain-containing protein [Lentisphaera profundi]WDE95747.1 DUF3291 domain-containing protein [Lentisphaera profundi]
MQLAQINIAKPKAALDDPLMKDFVDNLAHINALAESSEGFVWRFQKNYESNKETTSYFGDASILPNLSVWKSLEDLKNFLFKTEHLVFLKRRREWFETISTPSFIMWWVPKGHRPSLAEANERLNYYTKNGESSYAFTIKKPHQAPFL